jgi:hypothetical protein
MPKFSVKYQVVGESQIFARVLEADSLEKARHEVEQSLSEPVVSIPIREDDMDAQSDPIGFWTLVTANIKSVQVLAYRQRKPVRESVPEEPERRYE